MARKSSDVARAAEAAGATARPLVPLPAVIRALLAGASLVGGLAIELLLHRATLGAILVLAATIFAAHLPASWKAGARLRGPGRWLPVAEAEAFRDPPRAKGGYLDASTRAGKLTLLLVLAAVAGGVYVLSDISPYQAQILAFDTTAILAIFGTGLRSSLPPDPARRRPRSCARSRSACAARSRSIRRASSAASASPRDRPSPTSSASPSRRARRSPAS